jgi:hypothetical protein
MIKKKYHNRRFYRKQHPKRKARDHRRYAKKHVKRDRKAYIRWLEENRAGLKEGWELYYKAHKEDIDKRLKHWETKYQEYMAWCTKYPDHNIEWFIKNPDISRELSRRNRAVRRGLGFIPLNDWFIGCDGHHIDNNHVVYVPKTLHHSVQHSVIHNQNMDDINILILKWLQNEDKKQEDLYISIHTVCLRRKSHA